MQKEEKKDQFLRIGTQIYIKEKKISGDEVLIPWSKEAIFQDYGIDRGKEIIKDMPKYLGFDNEPAHIDYQPVVGKWMNLYQPLPHAPRKGVDFPHIKAFLHHIFEEHYELGLDYLQVLYMYPKKKLPILVLVSEERNTGKTTFLNFLKAMFGENATFNTNEDFRSQFNADWACKLLIMVDEALLNRREDYERFRNLSTAKTYKIEYKGRDKFEVAFYGKLILCSNSEDCPVLIDPGETRFWVRKINTLVKDDTNLLDKLTYEITAFLYYLTTRQLSTKEESRMWFDPKLYHTKALDRIIANSRSKVQKAIIDICQDIFERYNDTELRFCSKDLVALLLYDGVKTEDASVRRILRTIWRLEPASGNLTYSTYVNSGRNYTLQKFTGRYYTISREFLQSLTL